MKLTGARKVWLWALMLAGSLLLLVVLSGLWLTRYVEQKVIDQITALPGTSSSIEVSLFHRAIYIHDLKVASTPDSVGANQYFVSFKKIAVEGINLLELAVHDKVEIDALDIAGGVVRYDKTVLTKPVKQQEFKHRLVLVKNLAVTSVDVQVKMSPALFISAKATALIANASFSDDLLESLTSQAATTELTLENISINPKDGMYHGRIARFYGNTQKQVIKIDSAELIPNFGKYEFAHHLGRQTDRVTVLIPAFAIEGLQFTELVDSTFTASKVRISSFEVVAFRDKRVADRDVAIVKLPMESLLNFPWKINIDSVLIDHSKVLVEEIAEKGSQSSELAFEDINASITDWNNKVHAKNHKHAVLHATGRLMGEGKINAWFSLPLDGTELYNAQGSVSNMSLPKLNAALEPLANMRIETGYLNALTFNFNYSDVISKGQLQLDYRDLHLISLRKDNQTKNEVRTLLLNAIVKNDLDKSVASYKRIGEINIMRDRKRFIFNVWWKSIRDGLRSIVFRTNKNNQPSRKKPPTKK